MKQIKQITLLILTAGATLTAAHASHGYCSPCEQPCDTTTAFNSGFYAGIHGGVHHLNADRFDETIATPASDYTANIRTHSPTVGAHVGYLHHFCGSNFVMAPEVRFDYRFHKNSSGATSDGYTYDVEQKYGFTGALRLGYVLCEDIMVYGIGGARISKFEYQPKGFRILNGAQSCKKHRIGMLYGVGVEKEFAGSHRIRFEVARTHYDSMKFLSREAGGNAHNGVFSADTTELTVGYSYAF